MPYLMCVYSTKNDRINAVNSVDVVDVHVMIKQQMGSSLSFQITFYPCINMRPLKRALVA